jgi:predicted TIM-barrel fold metal-dependent hydrolase
VTVNELSQRLDDPMLANLPLLVSVDDHIVEPATLWTDRLPASLADVVPHVRREKVESLIHPGTRVWADTWHYEDIAEPLRRGFGAVGKPAVENDLEPMIFDEIRKGCYDAAARLADMDIDGVEASVCFPNNFVRFCGQRFLEAKDKDIALRCVRAYNDFLAEEWEAASESRLLGTRIVPLWDAELAAAEIRRTAAQGSRSVCFSEIPARLGLPSMYSGYWEPFFAACAETGTVINLHIGSSSLVHTTSEDAPMGVRISNHFGNSAFSLSDWLVCGAFIRYPQLKIAFSEGQAGWVPFLMSRLDGLWEAGTTVAGFAQRLPAKPSSYLRDHVYFCIFDDPAVMRFLDQLGDDNLCFETDYPHPDGSWPASRAAAWRQTATLDPEQRRKVLRTNAARLYRVDRVLNGA